MNLLKQKMKLYTAEVHGQWVPVWARNLDEALEAAELEYGPENVDRVKPEVTHDAK